MQHHSSRLSPVSAVCLLSAVAALLLPFGALAGNAPTLVVEHLAGSTTGAGFADGTGTNARFTPPAAVAFAPDGSVYIADTGNHTIRKMTLAGAVTTIAGRAGTPGNVDGSGTVARFRNPAAIAINTSGIAYVADQGNYTIRTIQPDGSVTTLAGAAGESGTTDGDGTAARFGLISCLSLDPAGNLYVGEGSGNIRKITPTGTVSTINATFAVDSDGDFAGMKLSVYSPGGIAVDASGTIYVTDSSQNRIRKVTAGGTASTLAGSTMFGSADGTGSTARFMRPTGVTIGANGDLFVCDAINATLRRITAAGDVTTFAGTAQQYGITDASGSGARFVNPTAIAADTNGNLVVADGSIIRKITPAAAVTSVAGTSTAAGNADGAGDAARFRHVAGVAMDRDGNTYVADSSNHTIRKITPAGVTTTFAGAAGQRGSTDGPAASARFNQPRGIAMDGAGNLYISDWGNYTIRKITPAGEVTTLAGSPGASGAVDATGSAARFGDPRGVAVDTNGTVFVADGFNRAVRMITAAGVVTTFAGQLGSSGNVDATGAGARFLLPTALAWDRSGNLIVSDYAAIRRIAPDGAVTTIAGKQDETTLGLPVGQNGDGNGTAARFNQPTSGLAVDADGSIYATDETAHTLRRIDPDKNVTTVAGTYRIAGNANGTGTASRFNVPTGLAIDASGNLVIADSYNFAVRIARPARLSIATQPAPQSGKAGGSITFSVASSAYPAPSYRWQVSTDGGSSWSDLTDSATYSGTSTASLAIASTTIALNGNRYRCAITNLQGTIYSNAAALEVTPATSRFYALASRAQVGAGNDVLIPGLAITGSAPKKVLIRALGPWLKDHGVSTFLADPTLNLLTLAGQSLATSDDWDHTNPEYRAAFTQVGLTDLPNGSKDAVLIATLPPGLYTPVIAGKNGGTGVALVEFYDLDPNNGTLAAISTRAMVGTGADVLIPGIVIDGNAPKKLLVRVAGPELLSRNINNALLDPTFELKDINGTTLLTNDNWDNNDAALIAATTAVGAPQFKSGSKDAALLAVLQPGVYTIVIKGVNNTSGVALVELFDVP